MKRWMVFLFFSFLGLAQDVPWPLESIALQGTALSQEAVLDMAGLQLGAPVNETGIQQACQKLNDSGLFASIQYRYAPASRGGYALTLVLADHPRLVPAVIDIPGTDEAAIWKWLIVRYPPFDHRVPEADSAQRYLAARIESYLAEHGLVDKLAGQPLAVRMESDLQRRSVLIAFQPQTLPKVAALSFRGVKEVPAAELNRILLRVVSGQGYTDRSFRRWADENLRLAYESRGFYRLQLTSIVAEPAGPSAVSVVTTLSEGPRYTLGDVQILGDDLPKQAMSSAAQLKSGAVANWTEIQKGLWAMEKPVRRLGYLDVQSRPERVFDDAAHILNLRVPFSKGAQYHLGAWKLIGLSPEWEGEARKIWQMPAGQVYNPECPSEFLRAFSKTADLRKFNLSVKELRHPDHAVDVILTFAPK